METINKMTPVVSAIGQMHFEGNVIPHSWYKTIVYSNGKPDVNAILILAEIIYWYRPTIQRDEATGEVTNIKKRFKADMLQRSYQSFADQFGLTKRQCQDAVARLVDLGAIRKELRIIDTETGKVSNVLFLEPVTEMIQRYTYHVQTYDPPRSNVTAPTSKRDTYTEITTEITTETTNNAARAQLSVDQSSSTLRTRAQVDDDDLPTTTKPSLIALDKLPDHLSLFDEEDLRATAYEQGNLLCGPTWSGFRDYTKKIEYQQLLMLLEWIAYYSLLEQDAYDKIKNMTGLIRSHLKKEEYAPLTRNQRVKLFEWVMQQQNLRTKIPI